jgi:hypothetical protein
VNFLPSFALSEIANDHGAPPDFHFETLKKVKRMVVCRDINNDYTCYQQ